MSTCSTCAEDYHVSVDDGLCYQCQLEGCLECADLTACLECDEASQYFLDANSECVQCPVQGCVECASISTCAVCDEDNNYFYNAGSQVCDACTVANC